MRFINKTSNIMNNFTAKRITQNAIVAALYFVLTIISTPFSFGMIQFRIAELLMLLCFFRKDFVIGVTIGCFLSNISASGFVLGGLGWVDALIGTSATLLSGLLIPYTKRLFLSSLVPVILNGLIVGAELAFIYELDLFYMTFLFVSLGEFVCISVLGYVLFIIIRKTYPQFNNLIDANINLESRW